MVLLLTISLEKIKSSRIVSCMAVKVWLLGHFSLFLIWFFRVDVGRILSAIKTVCFHWTFSPIHRLARLRFFWKDFIWGTGTKMMIAFWQLPTSISLAAVIFSYLSWAWRFESISSSRRAWEMLHLDLSSFSPLGFMIFALELNTLALFFFLNLHSSWWEC